MGVMGSKLGRGVVDELNPGRALRAAREARGLSIADLSRTTKIGGATLTALEESNVDKLPATIFTRGFLKAYADEVGLDPDETADLYLAQLAPDTLAADGAEARLKIARPAERTEVLAYDDDTSRFLAERQVGRLGWLVTAAAVVGLVAYVWSFNSQNSVDVAETQIAQQAATDATPASIDASPGVDAARAAIETPIGPLQFQLKPHGPCWLAAAADGNPLFARLLQAGDQETIEVHDELILRVGDPAALTFSINGHEGRPLGRAGEPVNVRITKDNFREFLSL
jgi:transcriptional regulator with XRE-family HTH domain